MTPQDLKQIGALVDEKLAEQSKQLGKKYSQTEKQLKGLELEVKLTGVEVVALGSKLRKLEDKMFDWKSEIVNSVDFLAKEIRDEREFREVASSQITDNRQRTDRLEKKVFGAVLG